MRPHIGVTVSVEEKGPGKCGLYVGADYTDAVYDAGGLPMVLPFCEDTDILDEIADGLDGLLLTGGVDLAPAWFGEEPRIGLGEVSPVRDQMEMHLLHKMLIQGKPIFGICRGVQVLNAALGGTLYQDLSRQWSGDVQHTQKAPRDHLSHSVAIESGTKLADLLGSEGTSVNSFHHQAVKKIAPGLLISARSRDGLIEGVEHPGYRFVVGVQWHPETLWRKYPAQRKLFSAFVQAAARE